MNEGLIPLVQPVVIWLPSDKRNQNIQKCLFITYLMLKDMLSTCVMPIDVNTQGNKYFPHWAESFTVLRLACFDRWRQRALTFKKRPYECFPRDLMACYCSWIMNVHFQKNPLPLWLLHVGNWAEPPPCQNSITSHWCVDLKPFPLR